jgi:hypothetical protein
VVNKLQLKTIRSLRLSVDRQIQRRIHFPLIMMKMMNKGRRRVAALSLREDIQQFISEFVNKDSNLEVMTIIIEPKQTSLHLLLHWMKGARWTSECRNRQVRSPRWVGID